MPYKLSLSFLRNRNIDSLHSAPASSQRWWNPLIAKISTITTTIRQYWDYVTPVWGRKATDLSKQPAAPESETARTIEDPENLRKDDPSNQQDLPKSEKWEPPLLDCPDPIQMLYEETNWSPISKELEEAAQAAMNHPIEQHYLDVPPLKDNQTNETTEDPSMNQLLPREESVLVKDMQIDKGPSEPISKAVLSPEPINSFNETQLLEPTNVAASSILETIKGMQVGESRKLTTVELSEVITSCCGLDRDLNLFQFGNIFNFQNNQPVTLQKTAGQQFEFEVDLENPKGQEVDCQGVLKREVVEEMENKIAKNMINKYILNGQEEITQDCKISIDTALWTGLIDLNDKSITFNQPIQVKTVQLFCKKPIYFCAISGIEERKDKDKQDGLLLHRTHYLCNWKLPKKPKLKKAILKKYSHLIRFKSK